MRLGCIDIGSNAIRLLIAQQSPAGRVRVLADQRAGIRLGKDAFTEGTIRPATINELSHALLHFRDLCESHHVDTVRAVGTSALRDSRNAAAVIEELKKRTGIRVKLIDGTLEAALLHKAVGHVMDLKTKTALLVDMGGGSLEVVLSRRGRLVNKISLPLGAVRLLAHAGVRPLPEDFAAPARTPLYRLRLDLMRLDPKPYDLLIGTGGNLRALAKLCFRFGLSRNRQRFTRENLEALSDAMFTFSLASRMKRFGLRHDRADVILPAAAVILEFMRIFEIRQILCPNAGLKHGLFWDAVERKSRAVVAPTKASY